MKLIKYPKTVKDLAEEIKKACDMYWGREISEMELKENLFHWASKENKKLFHGSEYKPAVKKIIGKKRLELLEKMLEHFQPRIL